jgi:hypothetical protein
MRKKITEAIKPIKPTDIPEGMLEELAKLFGVDTATAADIFVDMHNELLR